MRKSRIMCYAFAAAALLLLLAGCKPTEKNYRQAYETAQKARAAERQADADLGIPELTGLDAPRTVAVDGDSVNVRREALVVFGQEPKSGLLSYNVALAKFLMTGNAESNAMQLRKDGYDAFVLSTPKEEFYTCLGSYPSLAAASKALNEYLRRSRQTTFVGMPDGPVIEIPLGR